MIPYTRADVLLSIEHVSLSFGSRVILRDVNAEIRDIRQEGETRGQVVCFLGPSGIGKTQLSRIIAGLQKPTSGHVFLSGAQPFRPYVAAPGLVGMVPQNYSLFEFATVAENFEIAGRQAGLTKAQSDAKAASYVKEFGLEDRVHDYPGQLSGGTRQRVAIIRQLMCAGHYLVLDEPFSGLDPLMKRKASEMIQRVANLDEQNTVIIVTHDVTEGCAIADTVWMLGREPGLPGARLVEQYDLAERGLCWADPDLPLTTDFLAFVSTVKARFSSLI